MNLYDKIAHAITEARDENSEIYESINFLMEIAKECDFLSQCKWELSDLYKWADEKAGEDFDAEGWDEVADDLDELVKILKGRALDDAYKVASSCAEKLLNIVEAR